MRAGIRHDGELGFPRQGPTRLSEGCHEDPLARRTVGPLALPKSNIRAPPNRWTTCGAYQAPQISLPGPLGFPSAVYPPRWQPSLTSTPDRRSPAANLRPSARRGASRAGGPHWATRAIAEGAAYYLTQARNRISPGARERSVRYALGGVFTMCASVRTSRIQTCKVAPMSLYLACLRSCDLPALQGSAPLMNCLDYE